MARGIERRDIFLTDDDRRDFLKVLERIASNGAVAVFAWALILNHFHLLLRTGQWPLARAMRSLLSGYAFAFNGRHRRAGHLFQNRYRSTVCEDEPFFLELVRYIHLNPVRSGLVASRAQLERYPWTGHSAIIGFERRPWQATTAVLLRFGKRNAIAESREFVSIGMRRGSRPDLMGGGLVRSAGGWEAVRELRRGREAFRSDERILGSPEFVDDVRRRAGAGNAGRRITLAVLAERIATEAGISSVALFSGSRMRAVARARRELAWVWCRHLGRSGRELAIALGVTPTAIHFAARKLDEESAPDEKRVKRLCRESRKSGGDEGRD